MNNENNKKEIFREVQEKYSIVNVVKDLGITLHRVGSSLRANSIAGNGEGKDAFAVYERTNTWYDFMLGIGGDITDLVAYVKYNGDKHRALCELMPECQQTHDFRREISKRDEFAAVVKKFSEELLSAKKEINAKAKEYLHSRGITDETIRNLQIGLDYGFANQIRIRFPFWNQAGDKIIYYSTREFPGGLETGTKYMKASLQAHPYLRNAPMGLNTVKKDSDFCIITEGMFDWLHCYQQGFSALSPNGCDFGKLWPEVTEVIKQHFKYVILAFDNDTAGIQATAKSAEVLMREQIPFRVAQIINVKDVAEFCEAGGKVIDLINRSQEGLKWYIEYIKPRQDFDQLTLEKREEALQKCRIFLQTVSSYTKSWQVQEVLLRIKGYFPQDWFKSLCKDAKNGLSEKEACKRVMSAHKLMFNEKVGFYEFTRNGVWEKKTDTDIKCYVEQVYGDKATDHKVKATFNLLKVQQQINSDILIKGMNKKCCVSFYNGTLHIDTKTGKTYFLPHSAEDYISVKLPYFYYPDATCPEWEKFIEDVTAGDKSYQAVLQEFSGYVLSPDCKYQKALMLKGAGSNGKGVFTNILKYVFGDTQEERNGYVSYSEPSKFAKDFRLMNFKDSWLNISSDTETNMIGGEGVFKKLVAGEVVEDSYKYKDPFAFQPRTKLIMCCNHFPIVNDTSDGFMRRWLIVPFTQHYVENNEAKKGANDKLLDPNLENKLKLEISGIFNWVLKGFQRLIAQNKFTEINNARLLLSEFTSANNHLCCFIEECFTQIKSEPKIHRHNIYAIYHRWAENSGVIPLAANRFYSNLKATLATYGVTVSERGRIWTLEGDIEEEEQQQEKQKNVQSEKIYAAAQEVSKLFYDVHDKDSDYWMALTDSIEAIIERHLKEA